MRQGLALPPAIGAEIAALHARACEQLRLAVAALMQEEAGAARRLISEKERLREEEAEAGRAFAAARDPTAVALRGLVLEVVRDLRRVGGHLAATAHPLLERLGLLQASRLSDSAAATIERTSTP